MSAEHGPDAHHNDPCEVQILRLARVNAVPSSAARFYLTQYGHHLVYIYEPRDRPVLTCENHPKWYNLFLVMPDGDVVDALDDAAFDFFAKIPKHKLGRGDSSSPVYESAVGDHCWNPRAVILLAKQRGWLVDEVSLNVIIGRWIMDYRNDDYVDAEII